MRFERSDHCRFVQYLDRTAEKNPALWLPCVLIIALLLALKHFSGYVKTAYLYRNRGNTVKESTRKPFALRAAALSLAAALSFMTVPGASFYVFAEDGSGEETGQYTNGSAEAVSDIPISPYKSNNAGSNNYTDARCGDPVYSYISQLQDGSLERIEYIPGTGVVIERYSADDTLTFQKVIAPELPMFGGAFTGSDSNFLVFGQENPKESDDAEVMRVVKYTKDWDKADQTCIYGENTEFPFRSGSLRMDETKEQLIIHTSHRMYTSSGGKKHQSNMTFIIDKSDMSVIDKCSGIKNIRNGYVSHSFNQFVKTDGSYIYRLDHGDAYPRAVVLTRSPVNGLTSVGRNHISLFEINGEAGDNYTGVSVGGFELSEYGAIAAGNTVDQSDPEISRQDGQRNIFVCTADPELSEASTVFLTSYSSGVYVGNPFLVKISDKEFAVLWEETVNSNTKVKFVTVDSHGNALTAISTIDARLSDCQPVITSDGSILWYYTNGSAPKFVKIEKSSISYIDPDTDPDGTITANEPYINGDSSKSGWNAVISEIDLAADGSTVRINMNGTYTLPKKVVSHIKDRNITLGLKMENAVWTVNGLDVTDPKTVNLRISDKTGKIPESVVNSISSELKAKELRLYHNGDLGFKAMLTLNVSNKYNGYFCTLFRYDTETKQTEFIDESLVSNRIVTFELTHASYHLAVFNSTPLYEDVSAGAGEADGSVPVDTAIPVSDGITLPAIKLPQIIKYSGKKRRYRILKRRRLDDLVFIF